MKRCSTFGILLFLVFATLPWSSSSSSSRVYYLGKDRRDVVPIADADSFRDLKPPSEDRREEGNASSSRWNVRPNLNGTKIHAVYFQDPDYFEFQRGKRRATGICGDVWSVLADLLNFTLVVTRSRTRSLGTVVQPANRSSSSSSSNNDKNFTDLLGLVQQGRYEAIPKMEAFAERLAAVDFTRSIWKDRYRLFVRPYYRFKSLWMLDLFSWQVWAAAGLFYLLLVAVNVAASRWSASSDDVAPRVAVACSSSADYLFYGFGALCNQGEPLYLALWESSSRLLALSTGLFSWLLLVSYGSQLVIFMQRTYSPAPFSSLDQLLDETDYAILAERHSIVEIGFRKNYRPIYARIQLAERIAFLDTHQDMWSLACSQAGGLPAAAADSTTTSSSERPYAVLQSEYARMSELAPCELVPVPGESYFKTWIVAGLAKGCRHKRAIDSGITKLHEYGLINALKRRWLEAARTDSSRRAKIKKYYSPVGLEQLGLVYGLYLAGLGASLILVLLELLTHRVVVDRRRSAP